MVNGFDQGCGVDENSVDVDKTRSAIMTELFYLKNALSSIIKL